MLLQVSMQDIGQLPYFEVRRRSRPSPSGARATSRPAQGCATIARRAARPSAQADSKGAERSNAIDKAVPRTLERPRPLYGRMGNVDDAKSGDIRLLARSVQPSLTN
jgi:hypothetical protein